ncbi:MAG: FAD-binding oxidoreductase [Candidatus Saccharibacteria bacterium]|nr:FAD-binding oxidoreductase [Candidatus Saccharibacteria bacterium]
MKDELAKVFQGEIEDSTETIQTYSHDASLFEVRPEMVVFPKNSDDIRALVKFVNTHKKNNKALAITPRSAGTDMSGGAIGESIVMDMTRYFNQIGAVSPNTAQAQPGVFYRDFEPETLKHGALLPTFPASRELCTIGGMVANNSGGEMSLTYGKTLDYVSKLNVVLADGNEYTVRPLHYDELKKKMAQNNFEGDLYAKVFALVDNHYAAIKAAKPHVSKNSTGYNLWDIWDRDTKIFDLTKAIVGSQGTLGVVTDIQFKLVPKPDFTGVLVCFLKRTDQLGSIINTVLKHKPLSFESFDNYTLNLSIKFFPYFRKNLGWGGLIKLALNLIPDALILLKGIPKLVILIEFSGHTQDEVNQKIHNLHADLKQYKMQAIEETETPEKAWKFRIMRRESFNLLRKKVKDKHTAPFIDDLVVPPHHLPEFLPRLRVIINKYKLMATVAGHMGDGNFHIIPLMRFEDPKEKAKLEPAMREVNELVLRFGGSLSGEHNDGIIRGPWLEQMYGPKVTRYFKELKHIFDSDNIFNPHKKTDADWDYAMKHVREDF